jgi:two-component system LytT family response regulator
MSPRPIRVLIVDDEALARQRLEDLLAAEEGVEIAGTADNGDAAVRAIRELRPDLVFLDVQMPGKTGLEVVREVEPHNMPVTIFVTAYDHFALQAFELAAVDYLVKPFDDERFEQAFRRARRLTRLEEVERLRDRLLAVLHGEDPPAAPPPTTIASPPAAPQPKPAAYLERIAVEMRGQVRVVPVEQIDFITASGPYAELHAGERTYVIRERMQTLEERLDPDRFFRIHRSVIVRLDRIETLLRGGGGDYAVQLRGGTRLKVSRSRVEELEQRIGVGR